MSSEKLFSSQNNDIFDKYHHHAVELSENSQDSYCSFIHSAF